MYSYFMCFEQDEKRWRPASISLYNLPKIKIFSLSLCSYVMITQLPVAQVTCRAAPWKSAECFLFSVQSSKKGQKHASINYIMWWYCFLFPVFRTKLQKGQKNKTKQKLSNNYYTIHLYYLVFFYKYFDAIWWLSVRNSWTIEVVIILASTKL